VGGGGVGGSWGGTVASPVLLAVALARARAHGGWTVGEREIQRRVGGGGAGQDLGGRGNKR
jgi:hypothetical protein